MGKYRNLLAEMERYGVTKRDIANCLNISDRTVRNKVNGLTDFSWSETCKIQQNIFPRLTKDYLFATNVEGDEND